MVEENAAQLHHPLQGEEEGEEGSRNDSYIITPPWQGWGVSACERVWW